MMVDWGVRVSCVWVGVFHCERGFGIGPWAGLSWVVDVALEEESTLITVEPVATKHY
jgi:hypothetical protein